ncbi:MULTISPECIES: succinylglutamate desuccinylase/aspartoacylase family protein [unclassified Agarivorans]|uniref:succinylglutamate desuccinylase/aspartoacylase family protein n=1 Tax=unclassified Agarivorans TaxID=2636026 RepID=UPI003D7D162F
MLLRIPLCFTLLCVSSMLFATEQEEQYEEALNPALIENDTASSEPQPIPEPKPNILPETESKGKSVEANPTELDLQQKSGDDKQALPAQPENIIPIVVGNDPLSSKTQKNLAEPPPEQATWGPLHLLNTELSPNSKATLDWFSGHLPGGFEMATPVVVLHGKEAGPTVCLTAAIHGDEVNGVEIARRVVQNLKPENLKGSIISVPVVNIDGLWRKDRYMSDRRDLNRAFPGNANGSTASRVAYSLFTSIIRHCDSVIDLHSGSMFRENVTQLRADITLTSVAELTKQFGAVSVLQSIAPPGSLRGAATAAGIPAVVMEVGGPFTVDVKMVETGVKALRSYLSSIGMLPRSFFWSSPQPVFYASEWLRSRQGGILINKVNLGQKVNKGQLLGEISNPINNEIENLYAPFNAVVLGRAQDQFVSAGYAVFNLGERRSIEALEQQGEQVKKKVVENNAEQMGLTPSLNQNDATPQVTDDEATTLPPKPESPSRPTPTGHQIPDMDDVPED